jgi:predicted DNA-binding protein
MATKQERTKVNLTLSVTKEVREQLRTLYSKSDGKSQSDIVSELIESEFKRIEGEK